MRHELLEGIPYATAGASRTHNLRVGNLYALLRPRARERGCQAYTEAVQLRVGERTFYYPDLTVFCQGEPLHSHCEENARLVVEVLSEATEVIDRREKLWRYRESAPYRVVEEGEVEVPCLGLRIPLEVVYEGVGI
ncbi:Uma2 family endonuclease [Thermus thalpophilus]